MAAETKANSWAVIDHVAATKAQLSRAAPRTIHPRGILIDCACDVIVGWRMLASLADPKPLVNASRLHRFHVKASSPSSVGILCN